MILPRLETMEANEAKQTLELCPFLLEMPRDPYVDKCEIRIFERGPSERGRFFDLFQWRSFDHLRHDSE